LGLLPWFVSIWLGEPWKLALWAAGIGLDLLLVLVFSGNKILDQVQTHLTAPGTSRPRTGLRAGREGPVIRGVSVDPALLSERLGLFVIIVLGESVVELVGAASGARYSVGLLATGLASFVLLAGMFGLSVAFGYAGLPHLRAGRIPIRAALGLHCLVTGVVATVAVSLSAAVRHGSDPLPGPGRWLLCGAIAAYFTLGVVTGVASGRMLVVYLALVILAHLWFEQRLAPIQSPAGLGAQLERGMDRPAAAGPAIA
jgi:hypothetical protein